jgi:hypothetical protein
MTSLFVLCCVCIKRFLFYNTNMNQALHFYKQLSYVPNEVIYKTLQTPHEPLDIILEYIYDYTDIDIKMSLAKKMTNMHLDCYDLIHVKPEFCQIQEKDKQIIYTTYFIFQKTVKYTENEIIMNDKFSRNIQQTIYQPDEMTNIQTMNSILELNIIYDPRMKTMKLFKGMDISWLNINLHNHYYQYTIYDY